MPDTEPDMVIPDLSVGGPVTGASDGLGMEIARRLAHAGAEVVMPVRNSPKGRPRAEDP